MNTLSTFQDFDQENPGQTQVASLAIQLILKLTEYYHPEFINATLQLAEFHRQQELDE